MKRVGKELANSNAFAPSNVSSPYQVPIDPKTGKGPMGIDTSAFKSGEATLNGGIRNSKAF